MNVRIRLVGTPEKLSTKTLAVLDGLDARCFPEDTLYPKTGCYWWVAYLGGSPVAFAGLRPWNGSDAGAGFLCRAGVLPAARGSGLQRRLIRVRLRKAKAVGLHTAVSYTHPENFESASNLLKCGMLFYKPKFDWGCRGALYFRKWFEN